jgi:AmmeMemoRadiSam system protein A
MPIGNLTAAEKTFLMELAKRTVYEKVTNNIEYKISETDTPETLKSPGAAFVTLKIDGELRGCIGHIIAREPLHHCVRDMAIAACSEDPRFSPVTPVELQELNYEVTVLGPLEEISDRKDFEIGRHGLFLKKGFSSGTLLPQVPVEYGWDQDEFLEHLCHKAGLDRKALADSKAILYRYSGEIIEDV